MKVCSLYFSRESFHTTGRKKFCQKTPRKRLKRSIIPNVLDPSFFKERMCEASAIVNTNEIPFSKTLSSLNDEAPRSLLPKEPPLI